MTVNEIIKLVGSVPGVVGTIRIISPKLGLVYIKVTGGDPDEICDRLVDKKDLGCTYVVQHLSLEGHLEEHFLC